MEFWLGALKLLALGVGALIFGAGLVCGMLPRFITRKIVKSYPDVREAILVGALTGLPDQKLVDVLARVLVALSLAAKKPIPIPETTNKYSADERKRRLWN